MFNFGELARSMTKHLLLNCCNLGGEILFFKLIEIELPSCDERVFSTGNSDINPEEYSDYHPSVKKIAGINGVTGTRDVTHRGCVTNWRFPGGGGGYLQQLFHRSAATAAGRKHSGILRTWNPVVSLGFLGFCGPFMGLLFGCHRLAFSSQITVNWTEGFSPPHL